MNQPQHCRKTFVPFVVDALGGFSPEARQLLKTAVRGARQSRPADEAARIRYSIQRAISEVQAYYYELCSGAQC